MYQVALRCQAALWWLHLLPTYSSLPRNTRGSCSVLGRGEVGRGYRGPSLFTLMGHGSSSNKPSSQARRWPALPVSLCTWDEGVAVWGVQV